MSKFIQGHQVRCLSVNSQQSRYSKMHTPSDGAQPTQEQFDTVMNKKKVFVSDLNRAASTSKPTPSGHYPNQGVRSFKGSSVKNKYRNRPCPCKSGKKFKKCCMSNMDL